MKKAILDEVSSLDTVMRALYSKFGNMHKQTSISMDDNSDVIEEHKY